MTGISDEARRALLGQQGTVRLSFRFDILRDGAKIGETGASGSVDLRSDDSIGRSARLTLYQPLDWLRDEIKPYLRVEVSPKRWEEFPLGVFIPTTNAENVDENGMASWEVSAYDRTVLLRQDCVTATYFIPEGTKYLDAVQSLLVSAGADNAAVEDPTDIAIPIAREFARGTPKLDMINTLLSEINYNKLRCDVDGNFVISRYRTPSADAVTVSYRADEWSVVWREASVEADYYNTPNVFLCTVSNPDMDEPIEAEYINDDPDSPLSTVSRGIHLVEEVEGPQVTASREELEEYLRRRAFERSQVTESISFYTALLPHGAGEIVALTHPDITGIYEETAWSMELSAAGRMSHTARRISYG